VIFLTITALPESAARRRALERLVGEHAPYGFGHRGESTIDPSTMLSGGTGSTATAPTL
jgi:hypothetical protein